MKIYTSYFAQLRKIPADIVPISISLYSPKGYAGAEYKKLAPTRSILNEWKREQNEQKYTMAFLKMLNAYSPKFIYEELYNISGGKDCVLLCYEKTGCFCHRHIVAQWLRDAQYDIFEWSKNQEVC